MKNMFLYAMGLLLAVLLLIGCSSTAPSSNTALSNTTPAIPDTSGSAITGAIISVPEEEVIKPIAEIKDEAQEEPKEELSFYNPKIKELRDRSAQVDNYEYYYKSTVMTSTGLYLDDANYQVKIKGEKIKKTYIEPKFWKEDIFYDEVYLDVVQETAYGVCSKLGITCEGINHNAYKLDYAAEDVTITPRIIMDGLIPTQVKVTGETYYQKRKVILLEFTTPEGNQERLFVDDFYGLPLRQVIFRLNEDDDEVVLVDRTFNLIGAGSGTVKNSEVNVPNDFEVAG
ncbi:hypothetical protein HZC30_04725 [Candidatus Woesearchaeota archaeon]|nr:hypothetical protein [Candidatus Woesearchaeota archaeon]